ncbi:MAG: D-aminopeptidase [Ktedonobacterales bacterium]|jgi:D-aminopeptidase|nr:MAG: D-aminopeptidase [Ktedonobacterales bacterium]
MPSNQRLRDFGVTIGTLPPGQSNTLTDVPGVRVGHTTLIRDANVRTGVTAIWPHDGNPMSERVYAGIHCLNGYGEMTSRSVIDEWGLLCSPVLVTGTSNVGMALHASMRYLAQRYPEQAREEIPIALVAECDDGFLHDHLTFALTEQDVWAALDGATSDPVREGCVGGGTGMICYSFKGGVGSASRVVETDAGRFTVGVLVQTNFGRRGRLTIAGVPVGQEIADLKPEDPTHDGSCIGVVATDAPLHAHTLRRMAQRMGLGLARTGSAASDGSGEIFLAFSTAQRIPYRVPGGRMQVTLLPEGSYGNLMLNQLFEAVVDASEEAVINSLLAAETMTGRDGRVVHALPHDRLRELLAK